MTRQADGDLYAGLKAGDFCYVLNSRQMGKSSLRVKTMQRLQSRPSLIFWSGQDALLHKSNYLIVKYSKA
ncbi:hypothetical protein [Dendronalium sp. ChiSLP03b]|uniref:hypothetical protein n=1 Tax=Dendronalium sp. ChiSLP03b TaxID=3075381 RepID=UPI002AD2995E|nr:hypothetical protein [Dendronalium sp. ChiSLP03b]MDZ8205677.1 hypothetical protein [Dendronalium sp. ChiSLP03b]